MEIQGQEQTGARQLFGQVSSLAAAPRPEFQPAPPLLQGQQEGDQLRRLVLKEPQAFLIRGSSTGEAVSSERCRPTGENGRSRPAPLPGPAAAEGAASVFRVLTRMVKGGMRLLAANRAPVSSRPQRSSQRRTSQGGCECSRLKASTASVSRSGKGGKSPAARRRSTALM